VDFQAGLSGMVVPYLDSQLGNTPKWGSRLPLTTFTIGSKDELKPLGLD
jgi:hypothetical protein